MEIEVELFSVDSGYAPQVRWVLEEEKLLSEINAEHPQRVVVGAESE